MEKKPTKNREMGVGQDDAQAQSIRFLLSVINATIFSSGDDYEGALAEFFPQIQALGCLIGASSLDEVSEFLRRRSVWQ